MDDDRRRDDNLSDDIGQSTSSIGEAARKGYDAAKRISNNNAASAAHAARASAANGAANAGTAAGTAAAKSAADAGKTASAAGQAGEAAGEAVGQAAGQAGEAAGEAATTGASSGAGAAAGAVGGVILLAINAVKKFFTSEETRNNMIFVIAFYGLLVYIIITFLASTRSNISLDPIERSVYSTRETDYEDYPTEEEAIAQAINAINEGVQESYNRSQENTKRDLEANGLDVESSIEATNYDDLFLIQYNPFKLLSAYQVVKGARDYTPEKLRAILANADLFPHEFTARIPKTKQHLFKTNDTPVAEINGQAWDEPIEVPRFYSVFDMETNTWSKVEYDWNAISAGQDWFVVSINADTVTIGHPEEVEYTEVKIIRFNEEAALKAIGYEDDVMGDKYIEPDYEFGEDRRIRATEATYFDNFRELWTLAELFRSDASSTRNIELQNGGITVEVNITESEKQDLLKYCDEIIEKYTAAKELEGQGMGFFDSLVNSIENIIRPYVKNIDRSEPTEKVMQEMVDITKELRAKIETWETSDDPNAETVTADEREDAIETMFRLRSVAFHTIITVEQRKAIFKATRESINILDGTHLMSLDAFVDPASGELILAEYGEQEGIDITVSGEMSEAERALRQKIVDAAKRYLGVPYGTGSGSVDCSMLVRKVFAEVFREKGRCMEAVAAGQAKYCTNANVVIGQDSLRPGDLIFWSFKDSSGNYKRPDRYLRVSHVGIYAGDGKIIDASSNNGKVVYRNVISKGSIVMCGAPIYSIADLTPSSGGTGGNTQDNVPQNLRSMDKYGILSKTDVVTSDIKSQTTFNVRYYCDCDKCKYGSTNAYGTAHAEGQCSMSRTAALAFQQTNNTDNDDNDPLGSVVTIDGIVYKCSDYNTGKDNPDGNTILIYTPNHRDVVNKNYDKPTANVVLYRYGE